ncbi:unnamed protein product [Rotaria sp. Silwood2]|nr:unnamed protein product [Rotaria sp. Silwood2]CAF2584679.1 unnamed protein product [Rotaria sp. Silwood2]CAF2992271.1 unnamed protein product [Rotaria sp. Silwood2]CAF3885916.1 unnamed protein product [Rotaria sp. Silwood2]CAF4098543.1 unnamed protein product [Rotaria sp. Silwood2]
MPMHFPYTNTNTTGHYIYGTAVYPNFGINYNPYFSSFCSNSNGLLSTPSQTLIPRPIEQNKNLNIRENKRIMPKNNLSLPSDEKTNDIDSNDFLTFIEQKTKPISDLNPFANEFSLVTNKNNQMVATNNENNPTYKLIFNDLIAQSLQSIEAIKKASKRVSVNHVAVQHDQSIDQINCSTQTDDDDDNQHNLLGDYSSCTVKLMNKLFENFKYLLLLSNDNDLYNELKLTSNILDELHYLILVTNQIITSNKSLVNRDNLFSNMIKGLSIQSSPIMFGADRRTRRLISSSISCSSIPSVSSRQIDPITIVKSKICLLCRKPINDSNDVMHELCRLLSSPPDVSNDI